MASATIMIIRHAEKPNDEVKGIDDGGAQDKESLTPRGWARAGALACLFAPAGSMKVGDLPVPSRIYSSARQRHDKVNGERIGSKSYRPTQTVAFVAEKLGLEPIMKFTAGQEGDLADVLKALSGATLVSWQHERILEIAKGILGQLPPEVPQKWPDKRFDVVWVFEKENGGKSWKFRQVCQLLLPGDSSKPI
ncbi:MAG TPA: histidine phosphatase family protein [Candidatus Binataceae bacterium]|nr:histidine phosphatase family protein [Candidatus Binataceae bacterium]